MWGWIGTMVSAGAVIVLMRWMFHAGRPHDDMRTLERIAERAERRITEAWHALRLYYGPITDDMREAWADLHFRFVHGEYGEEGT